jgi:hypothetical protein
MECLREVRKDFVLQLKPKSKDAVQEPRDWDVQRLNVASERTHKIDRAERALAGHVTSRRIGPD